MTAKKNFWTQVISTMNGWISFGGLSPKEDVTHSIELRALDGRHFFSMEEDGERTGWTTLNSPGATQFNTGVDLEKQQNAFFVNAENGDVVLRAQNGKVRIEALDVEICATGSHSDDGKIAEGQFWVKANESIKMDSKVVTIDGKQSARLISTGLLVLSGGLSCSIFSPLLTGVTAATTKLALPKPGKVQGDAI